MGEVADEAGGPGEEVCKELAAREVVLAPAREAGVRLVSAAVNAFSPRVAGEVDAWMSPAERTRHQRYALERLRRRDLVTRALVRGELGRELGCAPGALAFGAGDQGRPHLLSPRAPELDFNLGHTEERVVLALARHRRVGVDIEHKTRRVDHAGVAERFFSAHERAALAALPDASARRRRFLELWVLKEAWMKADGRGIGAGLDEVVFEFDASPLPRIIALPDDDPARWEVALTELADGHLVALAWRELTGEPEPQLAR
ncbi:hypothetical protein DL240_17185 [Lujinxingia litoralis]|uniref:4'-phosphopantetheinyl transferase domain-containing protein n=1 Tax=Lujinxingia litoralis TaxID=2211119 RepID=A0A328C157_9DELT|nr:4'-phosphopantetheinyl transferase superfamily protein [Lujinxingia litoralis]RAL20316.1 hypothetical protein DL240_17185 [Lujinxingia litoralis]